MLKDCRRRPLPDALRQRLRDIPSHEVPCRDVERLYRAARARAWAGTRSTTPTDAPAAQHLEQCSRCRELYVTVTSVFADRPLPLPRRLADSLRAAARHPERLVPIWIADSRYAAAACYLLAALALSLAGEASALFRDTSATVSSKAQVWVDEGEARGLKAWNVATTTIDREIDEGWQTATRYRASGEKLFIEAWKTLETNTQELMTGRERPLQGDPDDRSGNDNA